MTPVPKNSMDLPVRLISGKILQMPERPGVYWPDQLPFEAVPPFRVVHKAPGEWVCWETELASCTSREAALAAMRLLGVESFEDWTK